MAPKSIGCTVLFLSVSAENTKTKRTTPRSSSDYSAFKSKLPGEKAGRPLGPPLRGPVCRKALSVMGEALRNSSGIIDEDKKLRLGNLWDETGK